MEDTYETVGDDEISFLPLSEYGDGEEGAAAAGTHGAPVNSPETRMEYTTPHLPWINR
jgi:hypothetical protein